MARVPDHLMMIQMVNVLDNDRYAMNRPKLRNYGRDEQKPQLSIPKDCGAAPTFGGASLMERQHGGLALIGWDHLKAFCGNDAKKGDKTMIHKIREPLVLITGQAFQSDDAKKSDTIVLQGVRCRHPDRITEISLRIVGLGDAFNSTDTKKHIVVVIAGALEML
ncbi:hypothetical protein K439DRAFT_1618494 [Ramaria rubella]|nr:hypothetical protein K439DRAFT_1618494 [Ramaria rubella]